MSQVAEQAQGVPDQLGHALLESRQRWRDFGVMAADIVFELDGCGRFRFLYPDTVLGRPSKDLLGRPAAGLLWQAAEHGLPFRFGRARPRRNSWVRRANGEEVCLDISVAPQFDSCGQCTGTRGIAVEVTERERRDLAAAQAVRRAELLEYLLDQMRQEVLAPRMMRTILTAVIRATGGRGAAVLDLDDPPELDPIMHEVGRGADRIAPLLLPGLRRESGAASANYQFREHHALTCPSSTRFGQRTALAIWRDADGRTWTQDEHMLITSVTGLVRIVLEHETIQRELARQARTDPLTGLLNRRAFIDEAAGRIDRLERDGLPGTLMFIDLDNFKPLNDLLGHEAGDQALVQTSSILRRIVRRSDLIARFGGDEFAIWLDGFDELSASERAEHLRISYPPALRQLFVGAAIDLSLSIGIACRQPGSGEELAQVLQRADHAMYEVKRSGRGHWRVSNRTQLV